MNSETTLSDCEQKAFDYELVPSPCCKVLPNGTIAESNSMLAELLSTNRAGLIGTSIIDLFDSKSHSDLLAIFSSLSTKKLRSNFRSDTVWIHGKEGDRLGFPCHLRFKAIFDVFGKLTAVNITFIDEREYNRQIEQMQQDQNRLKMIEKMKDEFIAVASHELRTPIQPILGFAMLAKRGMMSEEKAWEGVLQEARRLQQLANDILDVSRIESGSISYTFAKVRINDLLHSIVDSYRVDLSQEICLNVIHDGSEADFEIEADRARITQVIANLISNAMKFTEKGAVRVESRVIPESNEFEIRVVDNGRGLSAEILPVLFEKFATKGHGDVANNKGTGLGLYITKAIVEAHEGQISAFNNNDTGATFLVRLPISQSGCGSTASLQGTC